MPVPAACVLPLASAACTLAAMPFAKSIHVYFAAPPWRCRQPDLTKGDVHSGKLFPYEPMHQWLSYGGSDKAGDAFSKREFSFTLNNDIYIRFGLPRPRAAHACLFASPAIC